MDYCYKFQLARSQISWNDYYKLGKMLKNIKDVEMNYGLRKDDNYAKLLL